MIFAEIDHLELQLDLSGPDSPPDESTEEILKEWVFSHYKEKIMEAMKIRKEKDSLSALKIESRPHAQKLNLLDIISRVQRQYLQSEGPKVVFGCLLEGLLKLMDSEYGFIGEVKHDQDGTMFLQTHAITNIAWDAATRTFYDENVDSGLKFYNMNTLFGKVMTTKACVISNNPSTDTRACGVPKGHPPLHHFLGIPFFTKKGGEMNGMVGIANKPGGYSQADIDFLEPFTVTCSNLIQAYFQIQQNISLINTLEHKVTERTQELEQANRSLEDANRKVVRASAQQLEHFASMSHEIRTPLNCIIGLSSLLRDTPLNPQQRESLGMIVASGDLLLTVVNDVLDYSKLESGNVDIVMKESNLQDTINTIVHSIENKGVEKNVKLRTTFDTLLPKFVNTDSRRLQQILYNLLGNALKFSPENGVMDLKVQLCNLGNDDKGKAPEKMNDAERLDNESNGDIPSRCPFHKAPRRSSSDSIGTTCDDDSTQESALPVNNADKVLRFIVIDHGHGINKEEFKNIFLPFHQASADTERIYGGTGLGLSITLKLVKALGGSISVDSKKGEWSKFVVDFPFSGTPVDVADMTRKMQNVTIFSVLKDSNDGSNRNSAARFQEICSQYDIKHRGFKCMRDMDALVASGVVLKGRYICFCDEDLFQADPYRNLAAKTATVLVTVGRKYCVEEKHGHFRCFTQMIPSVLMRCMLALFDSSTLPPVAEASTPPMPTEAVPFSEFRVLVAEDNAINQKIIVRMLKRLGVTQVDVVDNGQKAVDQEAAKPYDVVLMDMQMPVMDGIDACRLIVARQGGHPIPKVAFVTAHVANNFEAEAEASGSCVFLPKPFNLRDVERCFEELHALGAVPSGSDDPASRKRQRLN